MNDSMSTRTVQLLGSCTVLGLRQFNIAVPDRGNDLFNLCVLTADFTARFRSRRTAFWRSRFSALFELGISLLYLYQPFPWDLKPSNMPEVTLIV